MKRVASGALNRGKSGASWIASGTYNIGSSAVSGGYHVISSGVQFVRENTIGPAQQGNARIDSDEEPSLQAQIEEVVGSEKSKAVNMDKLIYPDDKGKSEMGSKKQNIIVPSKKVKFFHVLVLLIAFVEYPTFANISRNFL